MTEGYGGAGETVGNEETHVELLSRIGKGQLLVKIQLPKIL
jgi:hypothetical protein